MSKNDVQYKVLGFEVQKALNEKDSEFYTIEGIMSDQSVDQGDDIVLASAIMDSVKAFGYPKFLYNHDPAQPLGVIDDIFQNADGVTFVKARMPKGVSIADDVFKLASLKSAADGKGAFGGMSIGFITLERDFKDGIRIIKKIQLLENSIATIPMNANTAITNIKNLEGQKKMLEKIKETKSLSEVEDILDDMGLSRKESKTLISKISEFKGRRDAGNQRDADDSDDEEKKQLDAESSEVKSTFDELIQTAKNMGAS